MTVKNFIVSFELMPPRNPDQAPKFWNTVDQLISVRPDFVSVTYGAGGRNKETASAVVNQIVAGAPIQPIAHFTCVGQSETQIREDIATYLSNGVRTFLALRGDPPANDPLWVPPADGVPSSTRLITLIREIEAERCENFPGLKLRQAFRPLTIAVAAFPNGNPAAGTSQLQEAERLLIKQAAGADFAITQLFWDPDAYLSFVELARSIGVTIPIVPGILPPTDPARLYRVAQLSGIEPPRWIIDELENAPCTHARGIELGSQIATTVLDGGAPGVHIYTFNQAGPALDLLSTIGLSARAA